MLFAIIVMSVLSLVFAILAVRSLLKNDTPFTLMYGFASGMFFGMAAISAALAFVLPF